MSTPLSTALKARRADQSLAETGRELKLSHQTLMRLERGTHQPSTDTAVKLARWLGWSVEQVIEAAKAPASSEVETP
jgi:DNA-binding XRE family transcriptional regulator